MSPAVKQQALVARLSLIEDPQERLAWVVERVRRLPPFPASEKTEANRVQGCVSRVWISASTENGILTLQLDADSTLVKGLAWLLCESCDGAPVHEVAEFESTILDSLHLAAHLSPTRQNGLQQVRLRIREIARHALVA